MSEAKFKIGERVKQHATHPDRDYFGFVERSTVANPPVYSVRWHRGYVSIEIETDLEAAPT